jgi:hypothetical protein
MKETIHQQKSRKLFQEIRLMDILHLLLLLAALVLSVVISKVPTDDFDEMALANRQQAKAKTPDIRTYSLIGVALTAFVLSAYFPTALSGLLTGTDHFDLVMCFLFLAVGLKCMITGLIFRKLEAN